MTATPSSLRARACSMASGTLSPATNRRAIGGIIRPTRVGSDLIVADPDGFGAARGRVDRRSGPDRIRGLYTPYGRRWGMIGSLVATAFWAMLPAYVPNNAAVIAGGGRPIDGGREWRGARLLGDGKTWRGTAVGTLVGVLLALALNALADPASAALGVGLPTFALPAAVALAFGAMCGDIGASFLKRRSGRERGAAFPGLDQLDFVVGALGLAFLRSEEHTS